MLPAKQEALKQVKKDCKLVPFLLDYWAWNWLGLTKKIHESLKKNLIIKKDCFTLETFCRVKQTKKEKS